MDAQPTNLHHGRPRIREMMLWMSIYLSFASNSYVRLVSISQTHARGYTFSGTDCRRHLLLLNKSGYYSMPKVEYALDSTCKELSKTPLTLGIAPWDRFFLEAFLNLLSPKSVKCTSCNRMATWFTLLSGQE